MNKTFRFTLPIILATLMLGIVFYIAGTSSQVMASVDSIAKLWTGKNLSINLANIQSILTVTTLKDESVIDGQCSLREALLAANTNALVQDCGTGEVLTDTINFDVAGVITLTSQLSVTAGGPLVIDGGKAITLSGAEATRIWWIESGSILSLQNLAIANGHAVNGAGLFNNGGSVTLFEDTLSQNVVEGGAGGGIYNNSGRVVVSNSTLSGNIGSVNGGGAIYNGFATLVVTDSTLSENSAISETKVLYGGAIRNNGGTVNVTSSTLDGNIAGEGGAISNSGSLLVTNSTLANNHADFNGGAINSSLICTAEVSSSTISGNFTGQGGALSNSCHGPLVITNSIVADYPIGADCEGTITDGGHNISSDNTCGFDPANGSLPNTDPQLGALQDNGGPTWTQALLMGSPAIDAGDNAQCPSTDQRGVARPQDGDGDGIAICDIGSFEVASPPRPPSLVTITGPNDGVIGQNYTYTATVEPVTTTLPLTYTWQASNQAMVTHTNGLTDTVSYIWTVPGMQVITVTASNSSGSVMDTYVVSTIDVPVSGLEVSNDSPTLLGKPTTLSATIQTGTNVIYTWNFGDSQSGTGQTVIHTYPAVGIYTATVTASNSAGSTSADTQVNIQDVPVAGLAAFNNSPTLLGEPTKLSATVTAGSNVSYAWTFGDGQIGSGEVITHTYTNTGIYTATVTASNTANMLSEDTRVTIYIPLQAFYLPLVTK